MEIRKGAGSAPFLWVLHLDGHDVIVHEVTVPDRIVAGTHLFQSHMFIKTYGRVLPIHEQLYRKTSRMYFFKVLDALLNDEPAYAGTVRLGKRVYLLEVVRVVARLLDGKVPFRDSPLRYDEILVMKLGHLLDDIPGSVHHLEHILYLLLREDLPVRVTPGTGGEIVYQETIVDCRFSNLEHVEFLISRPKIQKDSRNRNTANVNRCFRCHGFHFD